MIGPDDTIPAAALRYIAEDRGFYDFEELPEEPEEGDSPALPAKAHNAALWWVNEQWWPATRDDDDETVATIRSKKAADQDTARTWEDVRYCYEKIEANKYGRHAARQLLRSKYEFLVIAETEELSVYDPDTGVFTDQLSEINGEINDGLGVHWSSHERSEIIEGIKQRNIVERRHLNGRGLDTPHICVENGVLDLFERELKPHSPDYYFVDRIAVEYDDDASTAPYESFLDDLTGRVEDAKAMIEMVGHALVPDANERYKNFLMLYGDSDNGKTEFYNRVEDLFHRPEGGDDKNNISNVKLEKLASNRFSAKSVHGHMANIAGEIEGKKIRNTATIKDITGGDSMEIEPKGADSYFDKINATLMFAANDPPIIGVRYKSAIAKRIVPIELPFTFVDDPSGEWEKQKIPSRELDNQLSTDEAMSGFLNLALDGLERLEDNGDVSLPESKQERLDRYESAADPMAEFARECLTSHTSDYLVKDDVTAIFMEFAEANGFETGEDVHDTLHSIVRGHPSLSPGKGCPRTPDYSDTGLPLRPWGERKRVLRRVTLTDVGLEHARNAGIVVEDVEMDADESSPEAEISSLELGNRVSMTLACASVLDPKPWLDGEGVFRTNEGEKIGFVERGELPEVEVGVEYNVTDAVVTTDDDGATILELREGMTEIGAVANLPSDQETVEQAVADGGSDDGETEAPADDDEAVTDDGDASAEDGEGATANAARVLHTLRMMETDEPVGRAELAVELDQQMTHEQIEASIEKLLNRGDITEPERKRYRPT